MKILYATQMTGNGHIARAQEIIPILQKYAEVDILTSGTFSQLKPNFDVKYSYRGISLFYGKNGEISYLKILKNNSLYSFIKNTISFPINDYDLVINDFEPITAWAAKLKKYKKIIALSHQASLQFSKTPKPLDKDKLGDYILKKYAPVKEKYGFHFQSYNERIFTPVIRQKIKNLTITEEEKYIVYLPAFSAQEIAKKLSGIPTLFKVFTHDTSTQDTKNCSFSRINEDNFLNELASCKGVLCGAGFELPAETIFLKKKLFVIPIKKQREQLYNSKALELLGVPVDYELNTERINEWVSEKLIIKLKFEEKTEAIIKQIIENQNNIISA